MDPKKLIVKGVLLIVFFLSTIYYLPSTIYAQDVANVYDIADTDAKEGDIVIFTPERGITRTNIPYDIHLFGVLQKSPILVFQRVDKTGTPLVRSGIARVNVTTLNGEIKAGDYITSSEIDGFGMKGTISGHVVGVATQNFDPSADGVETITHGEKQVQSGKVPVALKIEYADLTTARSANRLFQYIGQAFFRNIQDPQGFGLIVKYSLAGLMVLLSIGTGFIILSRSIPKAIEAIGRNPLARSAILFSMGLNIGFVAVIIILSIVAALIILRL